MLDEKTRRENAVPAALAALTAEESRGKTARSEFAEAAGELSTLEGNEFALAQLKPLTPEQMCCGAFAKVTGVYESDA